MTHYRPETTTYSRKGLSPRATVALFVMLALVVATAAAALWFVLTPPAAPTHTFFQGATEAVNTARLLATCR